MTRPRRPPTTAQCRVLGAPPFLLPAAAFGPRPSGPHPAGAAALAFGPNRPPASPLQNRRTRHTQEKVADDGEQATRARPPPDGPVDAPRRRERRGSNNPDLHSGATGRGAGASTSSPPAQTEGEKACSFQRPWGGLFLL